MKEVFELLIIMDAIMVTIVFFDFGIKKQWYYRCGLSLLACIVFIGYFFQLKDYLGHLFLGCGYFLCSKQKRRKVGVCLIAYSTVSILSQIGVALFGYGITIIVLVAGFSLLVLKLFIGKKYSTSFDYLSTESYTFLVFLSVMIAISFGGIGYLSFFLPNIAEAKLAVYVVELGLIIIDIYIITFNLHSSRRNFNAENDQKKNEVYILRSQYLQEELKREEDTRKFRHDYVNHMMVLSNYINHNDIEAAKKYCKQIHMHANTFIKHNYFTGDELIDFLLDSNLKEINKECEISIGGSIGGKYDEYVLCTIISNCIRNAVEAVNRDRETKKPYIHIRFREQKENVIISFQNTYYSQEAISTDKTVKEDKDNHGIGLNNIEEMIKNYGGEFFYGGENGIYTSRIILPCKTK